MADHLTPHQRTMLMKNIGRQNTGPELAVRSLLHSLGYRFRLNRKDLPGTPDVVLPRFKVALFVHGCFWHGHGCKYGQLPKTKLDYWLPKIAGNRARDVRKAQMLEELGWRVLEVWQCELRAPKKLAERLRLELGS